MPMRNHHEVTNDKKPIVIIIKSNSDEPVLIHVSNMVASAHINSGNEVARILTLADIAWKPNDNEMQNVTFDDYDMNKWRK